MTNSPIKSEYSNDRNPLIQAVMFLFLACSLAIARETPAARATTNPAAVFYHPGVLVNRAQLEFIKSKVAGGAEPWKSAFEAARSSEFGSREYTPHPRETVECGPFSKPDLGCKDEQRGSGENGNKELSMSAALINIGVFNNDRATFERGVKMWHGRAPAYIYLSSDGPTPVKAAGWDAMPIWGNKGQTTPYVDGLLQESV